jgi:phage repressor protein C with HTH and peptisase S24 domain
MNKGAFSARKKRGAFPEEKLWALAQKRPDLKIDVLAVLTGISTHGHAQLALHAAADKIPSKESFDFESVKLSRSRTMKAVSDHLVTQSKAKVDVDPADFARMFILVPRHEVRASAGNGQLIHDESIVDHLAFKRDWLTQSLGCSPEAVCVIQVRGDSMQPTIDDADLLLLDMRPQATRTEGVYVIQLEGLLLVKRLRFKINGAVDVISDNARYGTETLTSKEARELAVLGRVVWHGRKF